jgi:hypothetical protein
MAQQFSPGDVVPTSGIYTVVHDKSHSQAHEVTCVRGEPFPPCRGCGQGVRFLLARAAKHLSEHEHFRK